MKTKSVFEITKWGGLWKIVAYFLVIIIINIINDNDLLMGVSITHWHNNFP